MGMIRQKDYTMPIPLGAEIVESSGQRLARWKLRNGRLRSAEVVECDDGKLRVRGRSKFYIARYRDGAGNVVEVPTGCKDEVAARSVLTQLERRAELIRAGVMTASEVDAAEHAVTPLKKHFDAYERHLQAKGSDPRRISMLRKRLERLAKECGFQRLNKMASGPVENWLVEHAERLSASTRNNYRESLVCFGNWCRRTHRMMTNPFLDLPRADQKADRRHHRRALTEEELMRLLKVARLRPLAEFGREIVPIDADQIRSAKTRATWKRQPLTYQALDEAVVRARDALTENTDLVNELEETGAERALMYKTLVLTGLRKGELASLTVAQLELDSPVAYAILNAADEKNRQGSNIPLRADLATELKAWMARQLIAVQAEARRLDKPIPARLPAATPLFRVPSGLARILDRDLAAAGISKRDERNRVLDVHALRVTFGTHLCAAGVPLRTAQAAMRHSKPELTANIYTDPKLLDVAGALNALPALRQTSESRQATG
jgi:integrase